MSNNEKQAIARAFENTDKFYIEHFFNTRGYTVQQTTEGMLFDYVITNKKTNKTTYIEVKFRNAYYDTFYLNSLKYKRLLDCSIVNDTDMFIVYVFPTENLLTITNLTEINPNNTQEVKVSNPVKGDVIEQTIEFQPSKTYTYDMRSYKNILSQHLYWEDLPQEIIDTTLMKWN